MILLIITVRKVKKCYNISWNKPADTSLATIEYIFSRYDTIK
jgi:hypothetical protein